MKAKRIILLRHGESEGNIDHTIYAVKPDHRLSLSPNGRRQAAEAGLKLKEIIGQERVAVYASPYTRTMETLQEVSMSGLNIVRLYEEPRLREQEWGNFRSPEETEKCQEIRYKYGIFFYRFPDGESGADVYDRVSTFLETLHRDFKSDNCAENVLIVTHGLTIRLFIMRWFHEKVETFESWRNPRNCQVFIMQRDADPASCYRLITPMELEKDKYGPQQMPP